MFYLPIIGSFLEASGMILEKKILKKPKVNAISWTVLGFLGVIIVMLPILYFSWKLDPQAYSPVNLLIFAGVVVCAIFANLLIFYSLKRESLSELEPVTLLQPFMTILLAFLFSFIFVQFKSENNVRLLILGVIASIALVVAHVKKDHITFNKYIIAAFIGSFLFSIELVLSKLILAYYSSISFYFLRCVAILVLTYIIFRPSMKGIDNKVKLMTILVSIIWVVYRAIIYYGYEKLGVVFTTTLFILSPVLICIFSAIFLKEKIKLRNLLSMIIILACVVTSLVYDYWPIILIVTIIACIITTIIYGILKKRRIQNNKDKKEKNKKKVKIKSKKRK